MSEHSYNKLQSRMHKTISQWLMRNTNLDPRIITLRIDQIDLSRDLSRAKIKCFHQEDLSNLINLLNKHRFELQKYICTNMNIRRTPSIKFLGSTQITPKQEVERLLDELATA